MASRPPAAPTRSRRLPASTATSTISSRKPTPTTNPSGLGSRSTSQTTADDLAQQLDSTLRIHDSTKATASSSTRRPAVTSQSLLQAKGAAKARVKVMSTTPPPSSTSSSASRSTSATTAASSSSTLSPTERARQAMKTINTSLQSLSAIVKANVAAAAAVAAGRSLTNPSTANGPRSPRSSSSSSASSSSLRHASSFISLKSTSETEKIVGIARACSFALSELRSLIRSGQVSQRPSEIEKAATTLVANLVEAEQYRLALVELSSIKSSVLSWYTASITPPPTTNKATALLPIPSFAHLLTLPLPPSTLIPSTSAQPTPDELAPLVLAIQQYAIGCLFRSDLDDKSLLQRGKLVAAAMNGEGGPLCWREWWQREGKAEEGTMKRVDGMVTSIFGTLTKGCVGADAVVDLHDLLTIRSRALLLYSTTRSLTTSSEKLNAYIDQSRKIILLFGRQAEASAITPAAINAPVLRVFQELVDGLQKYHRGVALQGAQWAALCEVILHIAKRAEDDVAIERAGLLLQSEEGEEGDKQADKVCTKLMSLVALLEVPKRKDGGAEELKRIQTFVQVLAKHRGRVESGVELNARIDKTLERLRVVVVQRMKNGGRLDALVVGSGEKAKLKTEVDVELRRVCETLATHSESLLQKNEVRLSVDDKSRLVSGAVESLILLAYSLLVLDDRSTYTPCFDFLERCLPLLDVTETSIHLDEAYWVRSLASAYYNLSGLLFNAGKPESTIRFVRRACEITRVVLAQPREPLVVEMDALALASTSRSVRTKTERLELETDCRKYATKRFELLALACHSIGDKREAMQAYIEALKSLSIEARQALITTKPVSDVVGDVDAMSSCKLVQRITKLGTFDLLLSGKEVSLVKELEGAGFEKAAIGMVVEVQIHALEPTMDKLEARNGTSELVEDLLGVYDAETYPMRRARTLLRRMQLLCAGGAAQKDLSAAAVASEIDDLCAQSSLDQDHALAYYKSQYLAFSHLWLAFHAHQARLPSSSCYDEARTALGIFRKILDAEVGDLRSSTSKTTKKTPKQQTPSPAATASKTTRMTTATRKKVLTSTATKSTRALTSAATNLKTPRTVRGRAAARIEQVTPPRAPLVDLSNDKVAAVTPKLKRDNESKQAVFEDVERSCGMIETMAGLLGALGHSLLRIGYLKLLRRFAPKRMTRMVNEAYVASSIRLAQELARIGNIARATTLFTQAEARSQQAAGSDAPVSLALQVEHHLLHSECLAIIGNHDRASQAYAMALKLSSGLREDGLSASTFVRIVQRTILLQSVALASSVCSTMMQRRGDLSRCLAPALQSMRLSNRALANITRLSATDSPVPGSKDDTTFTSDRSDPNTPLPDFPTQTKHSPGPSGGPYASLLYGVADSLGAAILRVATLYWIRGTPKSAEFFAGHALEIATQYGSARLRMRAMLLRSEVRMHLGDLIGAEEDLRAIEGEARSETTSAEMIEYHRLCAALHMRRRLVLDAKQDHQQAQDALDHFILTANENDAGGSPLKLGTTRSSSMKDFSPLALRLSTKGHSPSIASPPYRSSHLSDRLLPAAHSRLLRMHVGLLRLEKKQDECKDLLRRLAQLPTLEEDKAEELRLLAMIQMQDLLVRFSSDAVLGMLPESVLSMPSLASSAAAVVAKSASPSKAAPAYIHSLREIGILLQRSISLSVSRVRPAVLRELSLLSVTLRALQSSIGHAGKNSASSTAHLLDLGLAVTLRRDMLEAIDYKIASTSRVDDLRWPSIDHSATDDPSPSVSQLLVMRERYRLEAAEPVLTDTSLSSILPPSWTTISIHLSPERDSLILVRHRASRDPLVFKLPLDRIARREDEEGSLTYAHAFAELTDIIAKSNLGTQNAKNVEGKEGRIAWWAERKELDERLKLLIESMEDSWLGAFKSVFLDSSEISTDALATFKSRIERILKRSLVRAASNDKKAVKFKLDDAILECFTTLSPKAREEDLEDLYYFIMESFQMSGVPVACDETDVDQVVLDLRSTLEELRGSESEAEVSNPGHHLVLILDKAVQAFPWESLPSLQGLSISRLPSLAFLRDRLDAARSRSEEESHEFIVDASRTTFVINPGGDLKNTQARFQPWLERKKAACGWNGIVGRSPSEEEFKVSLASKELILYFGHGGAEQYIRSQTIRHLPRCAVTMLWGCSSGLLRDQGDFDPYGTPYHYMIAGCPSLVANLWDVTDKDIDTLTENVFKLVGLHSDESTKFKASASAGRLPSLSQAIAQSRKVCNLRYLNGAAVVNYGLPVWFSS